MDRSKFYIYIYGKEIHDIMETFSYNFPQKLMISNVLFNYIIF